jgi:hypothetical protein
VDRSGSCAREDFAPQCHSDDVEARKGCAAGNSRRVILARAENVGKPGRIFKDTPQSMRESDAKGKVKHVSF